MNRLENEVHQATTVMNVATDKLLDYKQLMKNLKYKKKWDISSANKFGRLANGVGGQTKNPTNTKNLSGKMKCQRTGGKM